jgi:hypothetical protein
LKRGQQDTSLMTLRTNAVLAVLSMVLLLAVPAAVTASEADGKPEASPQALSVNAGDTFDLEVPVQAWADSNYTVTFMERTRFSFPGPLSQTHYMEASDAILFKVQSRVADDTPDGEYRVAFELAWEVGGDTEKVFGEVEVVVGEGTGDGLTCNSAIMVAAASVLAFSMLIVQRRH